MKNYTPFITRSLTNTRRLKRINTYSYTQNNISLWSHKNGYSTLSMQPFSSSSSSLMYPSSMSLFHHNSPRIEHRFYAKSKTKGKGNEKNSSEDIFDYNQTLAEINEIANSEMARSIEWLREEFAKLRLGRANPDILHRVRVKGTSILKKANIFVKDPQTLSVTPFDPNSSKDILQAIIDSSLDIVPQMDADSIIVRLPKATKEAKEALMKQANKLAEELRVSIRRTRQNALSDLKKRKDNIPKDDLKRLEKEIQKVTDDFNKQVEQMVKTKEKDIQQ